MTLRTVWRRRWKNIITKTIFKKRRDAADDDDDNDNDDDTMIAITEEKKKADDQHQHCVSYTHLPGSREPKM